jgi:predicted N-formylglutamate amidohydrolase
MTTSPPQPAFPAVERIAGRLDCGVLFLCDHASNALPPEYGDLGLDPGQFERHIAYDIGAAQTTRRLAARFGAPALLTCYSRLLIDPNRGADDPTLVMRLSDGALIPGNARIDAAEIGRRTDRFWRPYRDETRATIDAMIAAGPVPAIVGVHSFTPVMKSHVRPWQVGILWDNDPRLARPYIEALRREPDLTVGDNEPYDGALKGDTMYEHGVQRGLPHMLIEIRQDLIADPAGADAWAARLGALLAPVLARPDSHMIQHYPSRADGPPTPAPGMTP